MSCDEMTKNAYQREYDAGEYGCWIVEYGQPWTWAEYASNHYSTSDEDWPTSKGIQLVPCRCSRPNPGLYPDFIKRNRKIIQAASSCN